MANFSSSETEINKPSNTPCNIISVWRGKYVSDEGLDHTNARIHDHGLSQRHAAVGKSKQHSLATAKLQQSELKWGDRETQSFEISVYRLAATFSKQTFFFLACFQFNYTKQKLFHKTNYTHPLSSKLLNQKI